MVLMNHSRIIETPEEMSARDRDGFLHKQHLIFAERGEEIGKSHGSEVLGGRIGAAFSAKLNINTRVMLGLHLVGNIEDESPASIDWGERERAPSCGLNGRAVTIDVRSPLLRMRGATRKRSRPDRESIQSSWVSIFSRHRIGIESVQLSQHFLYHM